MGNPRKSQGYIVYIRMGDKEREKERKGERETGRGRRREGKGEGDTERDPRKLVLQPRKLHEDLHTVTKSSA